MNWNPLLGGFFLILFVAFLTGCQTPRTNVEHTVSTETVLAPGREMTRIMLPGVFIKHMSPKAILDAVMRDRVKKKMWVKKREMYSLQMALKVPKAKKPTEALMIYTLHRYKEGLWLSAKVYQVAYPGTGRENILDVTQRVKKEVQQELNKIAKHVAK